MAAHEPEDASLASRIPNSAEDAPPTPIDSPSRNRGSAGRILGLIVLAGLLGGGFSALSGEAVMEFYRSELNPNTKSAPSLENASRMSSARVGSVSITFAAASGILGAALGLAG
ncbi:hypothetical protein ACYOEI_28715, partial [Singulisphaera rosea]